MSLELAPIGISVYSRLDHFQKCVESLQKNTLASQSELYIFSDASSREEDDILVKNVRDYCKTISDFKKVSLVERAENLGGFYSQVQAVEFLAQNFPYYIFMEDDVVTAPGFLEFMNAGLEFYKDNKDVFCISGYTPPIEVPSSYTQDFIATTRMSPWGAGYYPVACKIARDPINKEEYHSIKNKKKFIKNGKDLTGLIEYVIDSKFLAGDVKFWYHQALNNKVSIHPVKSLVRNIGNDGSGNLMQKQKYDKYHVEHLWEKEEGFDFEDDISVDPQIQKEYAKFWNRDNILPRYVWKFSLLLKKIGLFTLGRRIYRFLLKKENV